MKKIILCITLTALTCTWALAESSVWKAEKNGSTLYLGGTCHLLRTSDFPLPPEFEQAYASSDVLVFETDIGKLQDPSTQQTLMAKAVYTDGSTLDQHLSPQAYNSLSKHCAANGIPLTALKTFKPAMITVMLTTMELMKLGVIPDGVDLFFYNQAIQDKKSILKFETVDEQITFMLEMGKGNEDALVAHTIEGVQTIKQDYEALIHAWKTGDSEALSELMITEMKVKTPTIYQELLVDRNQKWLPMITAYQKTPETEFILVGAGHLVGPEGLIAALKKMGYHIKQL